MKDKLKSILKKLTPWSGDDEFLSKLNSENENGKFELLFENELVGTLEFNEDKWIFEYSEEYKKDQFVLPLINFPDIEKKYEFDDLMPFFATRIPNLNQPYHKSKLEKLAGDKTNLVSLLKIFGEKSINNPFELKYL
jgi:HipA-like protein